MALKSARTRQLTSSKGDYALTGVQVVLIRLLVNEDLRLDERCQDLLEEIFANLRRSLQLLQGERVCLVELCQDGHLIRTCHEDILLVEVICAQLVLGVVPKPRKLTPRVLLLVVLRETVVKGQDIGGDDEVMLGRSERPEVRTEDHDAEVDVHVVMVLLHTFLELVREILAQAHVCEMLSVGVGYSARLILTRKHALQLVRVFETASLLQLRDHARLGFVRSRNTVNETLRQLSSVECLEDVLILNVLE